MACIKLMLMLNSILTVFISSINHNYNRTELVPWGKPLNIHKFLFSYMVTRISPEIISSLHSVNPWLSNGIMITKINHCDKLPVSADHLYCPCVQSESHLFKCHK